MNDKVLRSGFFVQQFRHSATVPIAPTKNYVKAISIHLSRKKVSFLSSYSLPTHKKNLTTRKNHAYLHCFTCLLK